MKVLLINGSPHAKGCTYTALTEVDKELNNAGIETEIVITSYSIHYTKLYDMGNVQGQKL